MQLSHTGLFTFSMVVSSLPSTAVYIPGRRGRHTNGNGVYISQKMSPWPAAVGWQSVPGRKPSQLLHGRDFLF